jgi:hypothetical protein
MTRNWWIRVVSVLVALAIIGFLFASQPRFMP